jgi:N-acetylglucosamine-6-phosphate deacetylase
MMLQAIGADEIFTGNEWLIKHAVIVEDGVITAVVPVESINGIPVHHHAGLLVPSFIDIQLYGAYGSLLAIVPTSQTLQQIHRYCLSGGASHFLPTVATNSYQVINNCIDAVKNYWNEGGEGVIGLHVEGPWISRVKRGAHIESFIHSPATGEVNALLEKGKGVIKMITLAPEVCSDEVINLVQDSGIVVSAGHSNCTYEQATNAFDKGITAATHLYNAMSGLQHREPGMVGAILNHEHVMASIVPDGYHVNFAAVSIAKKIMQQRLFIITDAVTETNEGLYPHQLAGDKYEAGGILSGSALTMIKAVKNCIQYAGISIDEALRMASLYPAQVLKMDDTLGKIAVGYRPAFTRLTKDLDVVVDDIS